MQVSLGKHPSLGDVCSPLLPHDSRSAFQLRRKVVLLGNLQDFTVKVILEIIRKALLQGHGEGLV